MTPFEIAQILLRIVLAAVFVGMGVVHFVPEPRRVMAGMIPPGLRFEGVMRPSVLVALTGVCEIVGGIGLLIPPIQVFAALLLAILLVAVFPANAYASGHRSEFGRFAVPLLPRLLIQLLLVAGCVLVSL